MAKTILEQIEVSNMVNNRLKSPRDVRCWKPLSSRTRCCSPPPNKTHKRTEHDYLNLQPFHSLWTWRWGWRCWCRLVPEHVWAYTCKLSKSWEFCPPSAGARFTQDNSNDTSRMPYNRERVALYEQSQSNASGGPDFRSREDPDEHVWEYGFKDDIG